MKNYKAGVVGIVGRANVGKSTLLNKILAKKITITANKPQTTRNNIRGVKNYDNAQIIYVDTPGIYLKKHRAMVRNINRVAMGAIKELNIAVFVIDRSVWTDDDMAVLKLLNDAKIPIILVMNKVDLISNIDSLFPKVAQLQQRHDFAAIIPVSSKHGKNIALLENELIKLLPEADPLADQSFTIDKDQKFFVTEIIREKVIRFLGDELPYDSKVELTDFMFDKEKSLYRIYATIWVLNSGQKAIVIGYAGEKIKTIGSNARVDLEKLLNHKVFLKLLVKVKK